jgi:hypothetical protein
MKTIIAGPRYYTHTKTPFGSYPALVAAVALSEFNVTSVITGDAVGVDSLGKRWAEERNIPYEGRSPDYNRFPSRAAPVIRNEEMAREGEALIALWDGVSRGTRDMIQRAVARGLQVFVYRVDTGTYFWKNVEGK